MLRAMPWYNKLTLKLAIVVTLSVIVISFIAVFIVAVTVIAVILHYNAENRVKKIQLCIV